MTDKVANKGISQEQKDALICLKGFNPASTLNI